MFNDNVVAYAILPTVEGARMGYLLSEDAHKAYRFVMRGLPFTGNVADAAPCEAEAYICAIAQALDAFEEDLKARDLPGLQPEELWLQYAGHELAIARSNNWTWRRLRQELMFVARLGCGWEVR